MTAGHEQRPVLVTGATGFIGGHLAARLADDGRPVHLVVRSTSRRPLDHGLETRQNVHVHVLPSETADVLQLVRSIAPETTFHVASKFVAAHAVEDIVPLVSSNVLFPTVLAEALSQVVDAVLVDVGTSWQHFESGDAYRPVSLYAATKQACQDVLAYYADATPLRAVTLKLYDTYGPEDHRGKLLSAIAASASGGPALQLSPGEQELDLLHVDDVVDAMIHAEGLLRGGQLEGYQRFAVKSGSPVTIRELVETFECATGTPPAVEFGARPYRPREVMTVWPATSSLPGWTPRIALDDGLASTFCASDG